MAFCDARLGKNEGTFLDGLCGNGDITWRDLCNKADPVIDENGYLGGTWARALKEAIKYECQTDWQKELKYANNGPAGQVIEALEALGERGGHKFVEAADKLENKVLHDIQLEVRGNFETAQTKKVQRTVFDASVEVAAEKLASILVAVVEMSMGVPLLTAAGLLPEQLKLSLSDEATSEAILEHHIMRETMSLLVFELEKTCRRRSGSCIACGGSIYELKVVGQITYLKASDQAAFNSMQKIVNVKGKALIKQLLTGANS